jgi:hypothetical protein
MKLGGTEEQQIAAVRQNEHAIKFIKNPSEVVQLAAVGNNGYIVLCIQNPTLAVQLKAVENDGGPIYYIQNPFPSVIKAALTNQRLIDNSRMYDLAVNKLFKDNAILMKKWLRYGEAMRTQQSYVDIPS